MGSPAPVSKRRVLRSPASARKRLGREITQVRKARGLTQVDLADLVGSSRRTVSRVENGEPGVSLDTYAAIAEHIGPLQGFRREDPSPPDLSTFASWTAL
ncbi:helix-turn-helix transcriptional regulator [Corynebacterium sp. AOP40-9SA-29]|uniref:helix-turn-helix transcriptional regulator n=1 Tax=Corynebacterium sp. AOP40-9SA-29 TaxID=3457677 RepID=UPI004034037D